MRTISRVIGRTMDPEFYRIPGPHGPLSGRLRLPASKSLSNRALIAAVSAGGGRISGILDCRDTRVLAAALKEMGWEVEWEGPDVEIGPRRRAEGIRRLDLEDSGTGVRLLTALACVSEGEFILDGSSRLRERPMQPLLDALSTLGADLESRGGLLPLRVRGRKLRGGAASIEPGSSSQFVSALLMIAPLLEDGLRLGVEGELPSAPYLLLTRQVMEAFGAEIGHSGDLRRWEVAAQGYRRSEYRVEADWSAAAFPLAAVALAGGEVLIPALDPLSLQGDRRILDFLRAAGLRVRAVDGGIQVAGPVNAPIRADLLSCPDLFPALVALAAAPGVGGEFEGLEHLRHKESDRLAAMTKNLEALGAVFELKDDRLSILRSFDQKSEARRRVRSYQDHRITMAMAVAALRAGPLEIDHPDCVAKSFPGFWEMWEALLASDAAWGNSSGTG